MAKRPIELDCIEVWRHISEYIDETIDADLRRALAHHFKDCAHCSAIVDGSQNIVQLVGDGKVFELPGPARKRLYTKLDRHIDSKKTKKGK